MKVDRWSGNCISRRYFSKIGMVATTGAMMSEALAEKSTRGWIDAHVHVWTEDTQRYPIDKAYSISSMKPPSFTPDELFKHTDPVGIEKIVLIQMSFYRYDNSYMLDVMERFPKKFSGVGIVDYHLPDVADEVSKLAERGVRGFRVTTRGDKTETWFTDLGLEKLWKTAAQHRLAICLLINPNDIPYVDKLCERFRDTIVVVDHFARIGIREIKAEQIDALCRLARFPNVFIKTSAFYAVGGSLPYVSALPMLKRLVDIFGPQRLMWASDCPFQVQAPHSYEPALALIRDQLVELSEGDREWMLRGTAEKVFFES